jgi:hypothetical protein
MSRIILEKYHGTNEDHLVIGWDRPLSTYYWQEFNKEPDPTTQTGRVNWDAHPDWEEMLGFSGYMPNEYTTLEAFTQNLPNKFKPYLDEQVLRLLAEHAMDPNTGRVVVDLSERSWKVELIADDTGKWATNSIRFATSSEAEEYALDLTFRWTSVREYRVSTSGEPVNYKWESGRSVKV